MKPSRISIFAWIALGLLAATGAYAADPSMTTSGFAISTEKGGDEPECLCGFGVENDSFCFVSMLCGGLDACEADTDCPGGYRCLVDNCCGGELGEGACVPVCDDGECSNPGVCSTYDECQAPLYVDLASFRAELRDGAVTLTWTTASELDNVGFRLIRVRGAVPETSKGPGKIAGAEIETELLTPRLIPAQGMALQGASYVYTDGSPQKPGAVYYYLEDVDTLGKATLHGPARVVIPEAPARRTVKGDPGTD